MAVEEKEVEAVAVEVVEAEEAVAMEEVRATEVDLAEGQVVVLLEVVEDSEEVVVEAEEKEEDPVRAVVSASVLVVVLGAAVEVSHREAPSLPLQSGPNRNNNVFPTKQMFTK